MSCNNGPNSFAVATDFGTRFGLVLNKQGFSFMIVKTILNDM
jgi:hypothetical protein